MARLGQLHRLAAHAASRSLFLSPTGMVEQADFHDFDTIRMHQYPQFTVAILENAPRMGGVGEIGTPPGVAALANAVFALTGKCLRRLPLSREVDVA